MGRVTIKDIAKEAGVSATAVSLILRECPCRISAEKKALVRKIATERNYSVNQMARSLATKKSNMLALILPDIQNIFFSSLAKHVENYCRQAGYALLIASSGDVYANDKELLRNLEARGVDGIFLIVSNESYQEYDELVWQLEGLTVPYVLVDRVYPDLNCDSVSFDNEEGAYQAVRYMLNQGHKKIACVYRKDGTGSGSKRLDGYRRAMLEYGCTVPAEYLKKGDYRLESGYAAAEALLEINTTAAFICNDMMTLGFLKKLYEQGLRVPKDYSVVGYDDSLKEFLLEVQLTSVSQDIERLSGIACELMLERLDRKRLEPRQVVLTPKLIVRKSVASYPKH